jgi:predicted DNA-binding transcriptional regulator YafY
MTHKKTVRLEWLRERLLAGVRVYPPDAAEALGVTLRSIQRDLVDLQAAELPVREAQVAGRTVYFVVRQDVRIAVDFRLEDLIVTHLALGMLRRYAGTRLDDYMAQLMGRVEDRLSDKADPRRPALSRKLMVRQPFSRVFDSREDDPAQVGEDFGDLLEGLLRQWRLELEYLNMSGERKRHVVCPYTLLSYKGGLYLIARDDAQPERAPPRVYAVERIQVCDLRRDDGFNLPPDWDPEAFVPFWGGLLPGEEQEVHLRFAPALADYVSRLQVTPGTRRDRRRDGSVDLVTSAVCNEEFFTWVLGFGAAVRVLEPAHLQEALVTRARELLELYSDQG